MLLGFSPLVLKKSVKFALEEVICFHRGHQLCFYPVMKQIQSSMYQARGDRGGENTRVCVSLSLNASFIVHVFSLNLFLMIEKHEAKTVFLHTLGSTNPSM